MTVLVEDTMVVMPSTTIAPLIVRSPWTVVETPERDRTKPELCPAISTFAVESTTTSPPVPTSEHAFPLSWRVLPVRPTVPVGAERVRAPVPDVLSARVVAALIAIDSETVQS